MANDITRWHHIVIHGTQMYEKKFSKNWKCIYYVLRKVFPWYVYSIQNGGRHKSKLLPFIFLFYLVGNPYLGKTFSLVCKNKTRTTKQKTVDHWCPNWHECYNNNAFIQQNNSIFLCIHALIWLGNLDRENSKDYFAWWKF